MFSPWWLMFRTYCWRQPPQAGQSSRPWGRWPPHRGFCQDLCQICTGCTHLSSLLHSGCEVSNGFLSGIKMVRCFLWQCLSNISLCSGCFATIVLWCHNILLHFFLLLADRPEVEGLVAQGVLHPHHGAHPAFQGSPQASHHLHHLLLH